MVRIFLKGLAFEVVVGAVLGVAIALVWLVENVTVFGIALILLLVALVAGWVLDG